MSAWKLERHTENVWRSKLQNALTSRCRKDKTQGKVDWKSVTVKGNKQGARMRSDLPHPRATPVMASGGRGKGKMKKWGSSSLFFHFRQCEETARTESCGKMRSIFAWKNLFFRIRFCGRFFTKKDSKGRDSSPWMHRNATNIRKMLWFSGNKVRSFQTRHEV